MLDLAFRELRLPRLGRMQGGFNPMVLGGQVLWYDPSDLSTLFQDRAGTVPVTGPGQLVGFQRDKGPGGFHKTAVNDAARGTLARHPASGIRNLFRNSRFAGFTPQALPAGSRFATSEGATVASSSAPGTPDVSIVAVNGDGSIDVRVYGTNTSGGPMFTNVIDELLVPAVAGMSRVISCDLQLLANAGPQTPTISMFSHWRDSANNQLSAPDSAIVPTGAMTSYYSGVSVAPANTVAMRNKGLYFRVSNGDTVDYTLRVRNMQVEFGTVHTLYQATRRFGLDVEEAGGRDAWAIVADGLNTAYATASVVPGTDKAQVFAAVRKLSDASAGAVVELSNTFSNPGSLALHAPVTTGDNFWFGIRGLTGSRGQTVSGFPAPSLAVLSGQGELATGQAILRRNGVQIGFSQGDVGGGLFAAYPMHFSRRGVGGVAFNGFSYGEIIRFGAALTPDQIIQTERWLASKCGVAL